MRCFVLTVAAVAASLAAAGNSGCAEPPAKAASAVAGLPPYTPEEASVFGDLLDSTVFGLPPDRAPGDDPKFAKRMQRADTVVPVRITTVSEELLAGTKGYSISLAVDEPALIGRAPTETLELEMGPGNPSLSSVQAHGTRLVGTRFLLFMKEFVDAGEPKLHWYGEGDDPVVRAALASTKPLDAHGTRVHTPP